MRWLALKDLQILRRSPLLVGLLLVYPIALSLLVGKAVNAGPSKPKVAVVNEVPATGNQFDLGGEKVDASKYADELFKAIDPIRVKTREQAIAKVRSGEALAALIVPADITDRLQGAVNLSGGEPPTVEVLFNADDPLKTRYVESAIKSRVADANRALSQKLTQVAAQYLNIVLRGGQFSLLGGKFDVLGLETSRRIVESVIAGLPRDDPERQALERVSRFAQLAIDNLDLSGPVLATIGSPIRVKQSVVSGRHTSLDAFFFATAVTISLMFVCVLLGAGLLALEREEHAYGRLVRGLVSRTGLVTEKALVAALLGAVAAGVMLVVLAAAFGVEASRMPAALAVVLAGGAAFGALGVAVGAIAREVRAASLLAVLVLLPIAALGLVPAGAVSSGGYDVVRWVSAVFPFRATLQGVDAGLTGGGLLGSLGHLLALTLAFGGLARLGLRRFARA